MTSEENKMKTKVNKTSNIISAIVLIMLSIGLNLTMVAQSKMQHPSFATERNVKHLVYKISESLYGTTSKFICLNQRSDRPGYQAEKLSYTEHSSVNASSDNAGSSLEAFLVKASGLKNKVEVSDETELFIEDNSLEEFLIKASGLKEQEVYSDDVVVDASGELDNSLEQFLIEASGLKEPVSMDADNSTSVESGNTDNLEEFLIQASGLKNNHYNEIQ